MKKIICLFFTMAYLSVTATPGIKKISKFTGDLNGDGYIDIIISSGTNFRDLFGYVKVYFGTAEGISNTPGWTYNCDRSNFLALHYSVSIIGDANGDGMDELCLLLTNPSNEKSGISHEDLFIFYGKKDGLGNNPDEILKIETDNKDKHSLRDFFGFDYDGDGYTDILAVSSKRNYQLLETSWIDSDKKLILFRGSSSGIKKSFETIKEIDNIIFKYAGDVNNDGYADMLTGEPTSKGVRWMQHLGRKNNTPDSKLFLNLILPKATSGDGTFNNMAWDYNGDNFDDDYVMYVDAPSPLSLKKADSTINRLEFYSGTADGLKDSVSYTWSYKTARGTILHITACGDLNKDGFGDFVLQRFISRPKQADLMEANLLWGSKDGLHLDTTDAFDKLFNSAHLVNEGFTSVRSLGDINNDGYADIMLGDVNIAYGNKDGNFKTVTLKFRD